MNGPLLVATSNPGKLRDFAAAASVMGIAIEPLPGLAGIAPPDEDGSTFEENARLKAVYYSRFAPGRVVVADDSGLEVDALGGAPGVRSARYAAEAKNHAGGKHNESIPLDARNNTRLLANLITVPAARRTARFRCVLAAARDGELLATAAGTVEGRILTSPRGAGGFGYDPLFLLPELGRTMAELDLVAKQRLSHRGRALRALLAEHRERLSL